MAELCIHPVGTLLALNRELHGNEITEKFRIVTQQSKKQHTTIWTIEVETSFEDKNDKTEH